MAENSLTATKKLNGDTPEVNGLRNDDLSEAATKVQDTEDAVRANNSKLSQETSSGHNDADVAMQIDPEPAESAKGRRRKQMFGKAAAVVMKSPRGIKRRADSSLSAKSDDEEDLKGFEDTGNADTPKRLSEIIDKMESQLRKSESTAPTPLKIRRKDSSPTRNQMATPIMDNSRPSSGLSQQSEDLLAGGRSSSIEVTSSTANSPVPGRGGRKSVVDLSNPLLRIPMEQGWKRELVYRAALDPHSRRTGDIYYYSPTGKKLRSSREVGEHLTGTGLTLDNFSFFKEALGLDDPEKEIIRDAKAQKNSPLTNTPTWSPVAGNAVPRVEGKRTPKPKAPKGASPDRGVVLPKPKQPKLQVQELLGTAKNLHSIPKTDSPAKAKPQKKTPVISKISGSPRWSLNSSGGAGHQLILIRSPDGVYGVQSPPPLKPLGQTQANRWQGREGAVGVAQCSLHCPGANGRVPNLQCSVCLCLFHPICAGGTLKINTGFVCRACLSLSTSKTPPPVLTNMAALKPKQKPKDSTVRSRPPTLQRYPKVDELKRSIVNTKITNNSWAVQKGNGKIRTYKVHNADNSRSNIVKLVQSISVIGEQRYVIVPVGVASPQPKIAIPKQPEQIAYTYQRKDKQIKAVPDIQQRKVLRIAPDFRQRFKRKTFNEFIQPPSLPADAHKAEGTMVCETIKIEHETDNEIIELRKESEESASSDTSSSEDTPKTEKKSNSGSSTDKSKRKSELSQGRDTPKRRTDASADKSGLNSKQDTPKSKADAKKETPKGKSDTKNKTDPRAKVDESRNKPDLSKSKENFKGTKTKKSQKWKGDTASKESQDKEDHFTKFYTISEQRGYKSVERIFQYLKMRELAAASRVCSLWHRLVNQPSLWKHVRMKNSQVNSWKSLCAILKRHGTVVLDLRKMLLPQNGGQDDTFWKEFCEHIAQVDTLVRLELCRCPAWVVESVCQAPLRLRVFNALSLQCEKLDPAHLNRLTELEELRLKSQSGFFLTSDLQPLAALTNLKHLSLTSIKDLGSSQCEVIGTLSHLESVELGECSLLPVDFGQVLAKLPCLKRLRLERGASTGDTESGVRLLRTLATIPTLMQLELVNFDVKTDFDVALAECTNLRRLLLIPTYVSQSATTNKQVLSGLLQLKDTLTHLMWGVTIELLKVTELFVDQCEQNKDKKNKQNQGECIPVLKPVPGFESIKNADGSHLDGTAPVQGPPQVEILPLPLLQTLLSKSLPNTKLKVLRIPFHATWRQTLADFQ